MSYVDENRNKCDLCKMIIPAGNNMVGTCPDEVERWRAEAECLLRGCNRLELELVKEMNRRTVAELKLKEMHHE